MTIVQTNGAVTKEKVDRFSRLIMQGVELWVKAGELIVEMVDKNKNAFAEIIRENPDLSVDLLISFERIGRKQLNPCLILETCPGAARLRQLPYDAQTKYSKQPVEVLVAWNRGNPIIAKKHFRELSKQESVRVFSPAGARTVDEQKQLLPAPRVRNTNGSPVVVTDTPKIHKSKSVGFFVVRKRFGSAQFEKTPARPADVVRVMLLDGVRVIEIVEPE